MRRMKITGYGYALPEQKLTFGSQTRYRVERGADFFDLISKAVEDALKRAGVCIEEIGCIVAGMATPLQAIPCNAALIHERVAGGISIPAFDINSTCTSFVTAFDTISYLIAGGRYEKVLLVSGDIASAALNPRKSESYELFSDVCTAVVLERTEEDCGVVYARQRTWSKGAHQTEIPRGGSLSPAFQMDESNHDEYYFAMDGLKVVEFTMENLPAFLQECLTECDRTIGDFKLVIPHQASRILPVLMKKIGFSRHQYVDIVADYGNMVSGSIPFALCKSIEDGRLRRGDQALLIGTAAGLTINFLALQY